MKDLKIRAIQNSERNHEALLFQQDSQLGVEKIYLKAALEFGKAVLEGLWDDCEDSLKKYMGKAPSKIDFAKVEYHLGYRLPKTYKTLVQMHNGGLLAKNTFGNPLQRDGTPRTFSVKSIFGVDFEKPYSLCGVRGSKFWIEEWGYPNIGIAICDTINDGRNMIFLDYSDCGPQGEPRVVEVDKESNYEITYLADDFKSFIKNLFESDGSGGRDPGSVGYFDGSIHRTGDI